MTTKKPPKPTTAPTPFVEVVSISEIVPDDKNVNLGSVRGTAMIEDSFSEDGAGRSILLDRNRRDIAGNKTLQAAVDTGIERVIIVHTQGNELVAVQRDDVDLDSERGRRMAIRDNRSAQVSINFDPDMLKGLSTTVDLTKMWNQDELDAIFKRVPTFDELENKHGAGKADDLFVNISFKVSPSTRTAFMGVFNAAAGVTDDEKILTIIGNLTGPKRTAKK